MTTFWLFHTRLWLWKMRTDTLWFSAFLDMGSMDHHDTVPGTCAFHRKGTSNKSCRTADIPHNIFCCMHASCNSWVFYIWLRIATPSNMRITSPKHRNDISCWLAPKIIHYVNTFRMAEKLIITHSASSARAFMTSQKTSMILVSTRQVL